MGDWAYFVVPTVVCLLITALVYNLRHRKYIIPKTSNAFPMSYEQWLDCGSPDGVWFIKMVQGDITAPVNEVCLRLANRILYSLSEKGVFITKKYHVSLSGVEYDGFEYQGHHFTALESTRDHLITGEEVRVAVVSSCAMILETK